MAEVQRVFPVDGKPFFSIDGQARNSSGYNAVEAKTAFQAIKLLHGNTLEIPVEELRGSARRHGVKPVLLWFATWKNGDMDDALAGVKVGPTRFRRVMAPTGMSLWVLSSHCEAVWEAECRAFTALCRYLEEHDAEATVIALQIGNEAGILGSDKDYGPEAQQIVDSLRCAAAAIPLLLEYQDTGRLHAIMQEEGMSAQYLDLEEDHGLVEFGEGPMRWAPKDWRHPPAAVEPLAGGASPRRARGLVAQAERDLFYLVGTHDRLHLRPKVAPEAARDATYSNPPLMHSSSPYTSVDEGHLDASGAFPIDRRRNADEINHGTWVESDTAVVHAE